MAKPLPREESGNHQLALIINPDAVEILLVADLNVKE